MPYKPQRPCRQPGCPHLTNDKTGYCEQHKPAQQHLQDTQRGNANERGYTYRWHKVSRLYLQTHPLCAECLKEGHTTAASVVDHIIPHKGNQSLFWDESNWQSLCRLHHDQKTASKDGAFDNKPKPLT